MHETPSSHVPDVQNTLTYEPIDIIHRPEHPALPIVVFERADVQSHHHTDSSVDAGIQLRANIDGRSVHTITVNPENGTLTTDQNETFPMPKAGDTSSPISSIAEVRISSTPEGEVRKDITLVYLRPPK